MERRNLRLTMRHRMCFAEVNASAVMPGNGNQSNALALSKQNLIKKSMLLLVALIIFTSVVLKAQSPQKINFQSIVRNTSGVIVSNKSVKFKITILADSTKGTPVYSETHLKTTDAIGLVSLQIGNGTVVSNGVFSSLNWGNASHFIKLEADFTGGNTYVTLGTQELMSVPYAMFAAKTDTASLNLTNRFAEKAPIESPTFTGIVGGITKATVGLDNVDNTSDEDKPVSLSTQAELFKKLNATDTSLLNLSSRLAAKLNVTDFPSGSKVGDFMYWNGTKWVGLAPGMVGQILLISSTGTPNWGCIVTNSAGTPSTTQALVVNTALTAPITIATTGATGIDTIGSGLPNGVTATWSSNEITISGTPTAAGTFEYKILLTGGCGTARATGTITVTCVTNSAAAPSSSSLVVNTALTAPITIATTGATGIDTTGSGLPNGVTATWSADVITISGTPTAAGTFTYTIPLKGGCGNVSATGTITVAAAPSVCPTATITYNSYTYKTVGIGNQCWMAENLRTRLYNDNTEIRFDNSGGSGGTASQKWAGTGLNYGAYTIYANDSTATPSNLTSYGYLYNWYAVAGIITDGGTPATKNICPIGWHVPTDAEWTTLTDTLGGIFVAGRKMKSTGTTYWSSESSGTTNSSGFSGLPGGFRSSGGSFSKLRTVGFFWSATESGIDNGNWNRDLNNVDGTVGIGSNVKSFGASVRCLKNSSCTANTAAAPSTTPSLVVNTALTDITIATTGATGIDTTGSGLPNGVTATWSADVITISGTPTAAGTFTYTIPLTGGCGTASATGTITVTTATASVCPTATITDYNNINTYKTVGIGTQCWMKENLRTRYYNDGTVIPFDASGGASGGGSGQTWGALTSGAHTLYAHDSTPTTGNLAMYGYLYNGYAARGIITNSGTSTKNICPTGWHVPSDSDWKKLVKSIESGVDTTVTSPQSNTAGVIMREDNSSGFAALLGGFRDGGGFTAVSTEANFLSTTDRTIPLPGGQSFIYTGYLALTNNGSLLLNSTDRGRGMSIRCLKNSSCTANTAAAPSTTPSLVVNTALTPITIATTGATGIDTIASGLPNGVTATWSADVITISGTPAAAGTFTYTIPLTGGCGNVSATGTITVTTATVSVCPTATITYNGYTYKTVGIGNQCWMAENLRTRKYNDGTDIPFDASGGASGGGSGQTWGALSSGAHTLYAHDSTSSPSNLTSYGYLYNWYAVDSKKLCPSGWHVPQYGEWNLLSGYLVNTQGTMKKDDALWLSSNPGTNTNTSGFSALPGGERQFDGSFLNSRKNANFWSANEDQSESYIAFYAYLAEDNNNDFTMNIQNFGFGFSIRCLKDPF